MFTATGAGTTGTINIFKGAVVYRPPPLFCEEVFIKDKQEKMTAIYFKLTERERQLIAQKMRLVGVHNMSAYIRKMCIDGYTVNLQIPELKECSRYLQSASNNINQIAKKLNAGGRYYAGELADVTNCLQKNKKLFGSILAQLSKVK